MVGIDGVAYPYYRTKLAAETIVKQGDVPWSILRATQFHDLMEIFLRIYSRLRGPNAIRPPWEFQPGDAREVAARLVDAALGEPAGLLEDFGGPEIRDFKSIAGSWLDPPRGGRQLLHLP